VYVCPEGATLRHGPVCTCGQESIERLKNLLAICINGIAAIYFGFGGAVLWRDRTMMALTTIIGGYLGARIARRLGRTFVRRAVLVVGLAMGVARFFKR
jgi:uncharacterized membrane protein YfcA